MLSKLLEAPERPFAAIVGGAKVSDKIKVLDHLLTKVDVLVLGGGMANTFLLAQGKAVGKSLAEPDRVDDARRILSPRPTTASASSCRSTSSWPRKSPAAPSTRRFRPRRSRPRGTSSTSARPARTLIVEALADAQTVFWNGPLGVFEIPSFAHGTKAIARFLAERADAGATVVVGGGDSVAAVTAAGPGRPDDPHLHRRRRVARVPRGPRAAGRDRALRSPGPARPRRSRRRRHAA